MLQGGRCLCFECYAVLILTVYKFCLLQGSRCWCFQCYAVLNLTCLQILPASGRSLSVLASSQMIVNPDIPEAHMLRGWYDREGVSMDFSSFRNDGPSGCG